MAPTMPRDIPPFSINNRILLRYAKRRTCDLHVSLYMLLDVLQAFLQKFYNISLYGQKQKNENLYLEWQNSA